jgi:thiol-disulfide isomerase/thioredoxin
MQKIVDFQLPNLEGEPVRFKDLDADFVLIDFWGTWCAPCRESIPHLIELQSRYGPKTLRVVGVATEHEESTSARAQKVNSVARSMGVNYSLLLSEADGKPCPLQQALHVQAYPTMVLLDRTGRILWRGTGAEGVTLSRLDRVIASRADTDVVKR